MLIKLTQKTIDATYIEEVPNEAKVSRIREIASEKFKIPQPAIKLVVNDKVLDMEQTIGEQLLSNDTVIVELDEENFESNETQIRVQQLKEKLISSHDVIQLLTHFKKNEKLIDTFIISAQDRLSKSLKIIRFVDELKKMEVTDKEAIQKKVEQGVNEWQDRVETIFPHSYLSHTKGFIDHTLIGEVQVQQANEKLKSESGNMPLALVDDTPLKPSSLKGPESDFYELTELENKNITTVLVENLFTELAVMMLLLQERVEKLDKEKDKIKDYKQRDIVEDIKKLYMTVVYNLMELIDIKDLLLGQYIGRQHKFDAETAKQGFRAYINKLRGIYKDELEQILQAGVGPAKEAEILQRLEQTNGDVTKVLDEFL